MKSFLFFILLFCGIATNAQRALTIEEARPQMPHLDSIYKTALNADSSKAVFNTTESSGKMMKAYEKLHQDMADYLKKKGFKWEKTTRFFNRVYFNENGGIDYFIFGIRGKPEELPSPEKQKEFQALLQAFIEDYNIGMKADTKFLQCGPSAHAEGK